MYITIIIPAHNEEKYIADCLHSFVQQTDPPEELIIVDDNSTDGTFEIASRFAQDHPWITVIQHTSSKKHLPGKKVVQAFDFGLSRTKEKYDLIGKFDADIVLPPNYFEQLRNHFRSNWLLGMCSGLLYIEKKGKWVYENIANKNHVRGPIKLYFRRVFEQIGGLRQDVGWDTVDVLLCQFHGFEVRTDDSLIVKHLRPTGHGYSTRNYRSKGEALYRMRYGLPLAKLALLKMALHGKSPKLYFQGFLGYVLAWTRNLPRFVTNEEGRFIRKLRWNGILDQLF